MDRYVIPDSHEQIIFRTGSAAVLASMERFAFDRECSIRKAWETIKQVGDCDLRSCMFADRTIEALYCEIC